MSEKHLAVYLNDHLAGGVAALELLSTLEKTDTPAGIAAFAAGLRTEIAADVEALRGLMSMAAVPESRTRQTVGWLGEKIAQLKVRLDDPGDGALRLFETLEALAIGIEGKRALWDAVSTAAATVPSLNGPDYARLQRRAIDQRSRVEARRLEAARAALGR